MHRRTVKKLPAINGSEYPMSLSLFQMANYWVDTGPFGPLSAVYRSFRPLAYRLFE
jgi:hypothetical protein